MSLVLQVCLDLKREKFKLYFLSFFPAFSSRKLWYKRPDTTDSSSVFSCEIKVGPEEWWEGGIFLVFIDDSERDDWYKHWKKHIP